MNFTLKSHLPLHLKILSIIFVTFASTMAITLIGLWHYQQNMLIDIYRQNAVKIGKTITFGLREAMMANDQKSIAKIIKEISNTTSPANQISIINRKCKTTISSEKELIDLRVKQISDPICSYCHVPNTPTSSQGYASVIIETQDGPMLRTMLKIYNSEQCHDCHAPSHKTNGILLIDSPLKDIHDHIQAIAWRITLTGCAAFILIFIIISYFVNIFITKPIQTIMHGIRDIEHGDLESWLDIDADGEFHDMVTSFNVMKKAINRYLLEAKQKKKEIATLYSMAYQLSETIGLSEIKKIAVNFLWQAFNAQSVTLILEMEQGNNSFEFSWKDSEDNFESSKFDLNYEIPPMPEFSLEGLCKWFEKEFNEPFFFDNDQKTIIPLRVKDMQLGLLVITKKQDEPFVISEKNILPAIMHHISIALANARLYNIAITDDLTKFHTKRYFHAKLIDLERTRNINGIKYCVLMLDLDHFKKINDKFGHPIGDKLLAEVAELIRSKLRPQDIPNRYGGEEFVILLPSCDVDCALTIAERLRETIAQHIFRYDEIPHIRQTVSIGVACCTDNTSCKTNIVKAADKALYEAKQSGRNRVCQHQIIN